MYVPLRVKARYGEQAKHEAENVESGLHKCGATIA